MKIAYDEDLISSDAAYPKVMGLKRMLEGRSAVVSYSGGVDSTFLVLAAGAFCTRTLAVTANSPTLAPGELERARDLAQKMGVDHRIITYDELDDPDFARNPENRCYYCKRGLVHHLKEIAANEGFDLVLEGTNASDVMGHRPGRQAVVEIGAISPLHDQGLSKEDVRRLSRKLGLPTWNRPSMPCLASRVPYEVPITHGGLQRIGRAEAYLRDLGFDVVRVRDHGEVARIELDRERIRDLLKDGLADAVSRELRSLGWTHVAIDLQGYRTGSMNEGSATITGSSPRPEET